MNTVWKNELTSMIRICASITESNIEDCLKAISKAKELGARIVELRIDFLDNHEEISKIIQQAKLPLIATNRSKKEGGEFEGNEEERINSLINAIDDGCEFVDIELNTNKKLRGRVTNLARRNKCEVIVSIHDFKKTPNMKNLNKLLTEEKAIADIGKIVTFGNKNEDTIKIFNLLRIANSRNFPLITFAMGSLCSFSRIVAPLFGSYLTYVSVGKPSAIGQMNIREMVNVYKQLGVKI